MLTFSRSISLGKYGTFPSNLIIERPFHVTYEIQDKREGETFSRLRVVPATELNADILAETNTNEDGEAEAEAEGDDDAAGVTVTENEGGDLTLIDGSGKVVARTNRQTIDDSARQTLTTAEIEELKKKGASAGKDLIAKLMLSHTALDEKTAYSLAKYKLLKERKFLRRFTVLPLDAATLGQWILDDRDATKILEMRHEMMGLIGCWADVRFGGSPIEGATAPHGGRWLAVDETGGLLVALMAERMDLLHRPLAPGDEDASRKRQRADDMADHYAQTNTITLVHSNTQPNLSLLKYFDYDANDASPVPPHHPLHTHLLPISWLQLISPDEDPSYSEKPDDVTADEFSTWKPNRRGNYHRKRRRWARTHQIVDSTRGGGFSGLAIASGMDPVSTLRQLLPLLAGGSPIAIYSPTIEPLEQLVDCFSIARRAAWVSSPPADVDGKSPAELESWSGSREYPVNPTLVVGAGVQTSRARRWQVLPGRTHPVMTGRGGAEGYLFTAWRAIPAEGRISARGKFQKKK